MSFVWAEIPLRVLYRGVFFGTSIRYLEAEWQCPTCGRPVRGSLEVLPEGERRLPCGVDECNAVWAWNGAQLRLVGPGVPSLVDPVEGVWEAEEDEP